MLGGGERKLPQATETLAGGRTEDVIKNPCFFDFIARAGRSQGGIMTTEITAAWKPGLESLFHADAQKVAEEIISIGESATPQQILDKARDETTELHKCLEWDDGIAAEKYRLQQCRTVARCLVIHETIVEKRPTVRFFFKPEQSSGYQQTRMIVRNEDKYRSLLDAALSELSAFQQKYRTLTELETVFEEIEKLIKAS